MAYHAAPPLRVRPMPAAMQAKPSPPRPSKTTADDPSASLRTALQTQGFDFLPAQWAMAQSHPATQGGQAQDVVALYLEHCQINHQVFANVKPHERAMLPGHTLCQTEDGGLVLLHTLKKSNPSIAWALVIAPSERQVGTTTAQKKPQSLRQFWHQLRGSAWLEAAMKPALSHLRPVIFASLLINILGLAAPFFSLQVYDRIIPNAAYASLFALFLGVILSLLFEDLLKNARYKLMEHAATMADGICSKTLSEQLLQVKTHNAEPAELLQHLRSFDQLRELITGVFLLALIDIPFLLVFLLVIAVIHPAFLLIAGGLIGLTLLTIWVSHRKLAHYSAQHLMSYRHAQGQWLDTLGNLEIIQAQGVQSHFSHSLNGVQMTTRLEGNAIRNLLFHSSQWMHFLQQSSWVLTIVLGVYLVVNQHLTIGGLIAVSMLTMRCFGPVQKLHGHLMQTHAAQASFEDLNRFLSLPKKNTSSLQSMPQFESLQLLQADVLKPQRPADSQLDGDHLLRNINLTINQGARIGVIGATGSGKTSLLKLLSTQLTPDRGEFRLNALDHQLIAPLEYARHLGVALQPPLLIKGTLLDNIGLKRPWVSPQDCIEALAAVGLSHWVQEHPKGLHMPIESQGGNVSSGQKQAIALARALAGKPSILLLDEPTVCLDQRCESALVNTLMQLPSHMTLIFTTHKLNVLGAAQQLVFMHQSRIYAQGDKAEVMLAAQQLAQANQTNTHSSNTGASS